MLFKSAASITGLLLASFVSQSVAVDLTGYEYIVIGSGAGGGPLAARLALAGKKTLLIEAGNDQGSNENYTVPAFQAKSTEDPAMSWDFYVNHYQDEARQKRDYKLTYTTPSGKLYVGKDAPAGSTVKGILYPRNQQLGGCTGHNALVSIYPHKTDFQYIADLTGDQSWVPSNVRKYFVKAENVQYGLGLTNHGYFGWFYTSFAPLTLAIKDTYLFNMVVGAATALNLGKTTLANLAQVLGGDPNEDSTKRDQSNGIYQVPISSKNGQRWTTREFLLDVYNAKNVTGGKAYPLDIRMDCFVTKITFDKSTPPKATGVEFLDGKYLYKASPRSSAGNTGIPGTAKASKEVILAGGSYNSPQTLKLSGIGPRAELEKFGIPVIKDLPGVGANLQDHYEVMVQGSMAQDFPVLANCTFDYTKPDKCLDQWKAAPLGDRGTYASSGFAAAMTYKTSQSDDGNFDELAFGGPVNFRGYFPGYAYNATQYHNWWTWALLKGHPRNRAGTVTLRSANPLDTPAINFNYFDQGSGDYTKDLKAIVEAIRLARSAFASQSTPFTEILPGAALQTDAELSQWVADTAWGHHCSSTCAIGADNDPNAVLDSSFRVRGVSGLRVVDASVFPKIPGVFTLISTYIVGEKAADVILNPTK